MLALHTAEPADLRPLATLLAKAQTRPSTHMGFMGLQAEQIYDELLELDPPATRTFVLAKDGAQICAGIGFDLDLERGRAYVWGPFVFTGAPGSSEELVRQLWQQARALLPAQITLLDVFCNAANHTVRAWATALGLPLRGEELIYVLKREEFTPTPGAIQPLRPEQHAAFIALHEQTFPNTYYNGSTIIERINTERQVFASGSGAALDGYIYVEAMPEHGEGMIEFVGVAPAARGQGLAKQLLAHALEWMFQWATINEIELVVNARNTAAQRLYQSAGFSLRFTMINYRWEGPGGSVPSVSAAKAGALIEAVDNHA